MAELPRSYSAAWELCWSLFHASRIAFSIGQDQVDAGIEVLFELYEARTIGQSQPLKQQFPASVIDTVKSGRVAMFAGNTRAQAGLWSGQKAGAEVNERELKLFTGF